MSENEKEEAAIKVYKRRWVVLTIYIICVAINAFQWIEYVIISNVIMEFYNMSSVAVAWTSIIYMASYAILIVPASYVIDKKGIRIAVLLGGVSTALGTILKVFSVERSRFWLVMLCQALLSAAQTLIASLPAKLAAVWFGPDQVSTACALGLTGQQLGVAAGFIVPPLLVKNHEDINKTGDDLYLLTWILAGFMIPIAIAIVVYFPDKPPLPPSQAQLNERNSERESFVKSLKVLLTNKAFLIHNLAYAINGSVLSALATFLNQFTLYYFKDNEQDAGILGLLLIVLGMIGSVLIGIILDKTKQYKLWLLVAYILCFLSTAAYLISLEYIRSMVMVYIATTLLGLFTGAYANASFEMLVELTFPSSESTASGILLSIMQIVGTIDAVLVGWLNDACGCFWAIFSQAVLMLVGVGVTWYTPNDLRRQAALKEGQKCLDVEYKAVATSEKA